MNGILSAWVGTAAFRERERAKERQQYRRTSTPTPRNIVSQSSTCQPAASHPFSLEILLDTASDCSPDPYIPPPTRVCASTAIKVYIYAAKDGFAKLSTIASHQSFVTHVDFSCDGNYVQSADGANSLLFADAATGIQIPSEFVVFCSFIMYRPVCRSV